LSQSELCARICLKALATWYTNNPVVAGQFIQVKWNSSSSQLNQYPTQCICPSERPPISVKSYQ